MQNSDLFDPLVTNFQRNIFFSLACYKISDPLPLKCEHNKPTTKNFVFFSKKNYRYILKFQSMHLQITIQNNYFMPFKIQINQYINTLIYFIIVLKNRLRCQLRKSIIARTHVTISFISVALYVSIDTNSIKEKQIVLWYLK